MKKIFSFIAALIFTFCLIHPAIAEQPQEQEDQQPVFHIVYTLYDGVKLYGIAETPDDSRTYFARCAFFTENGDFFIVLTPIFRPYGEFYTYVVANVQHLAIQIVDDPYSIIPGQYTVQDAAQGLLW